MGSLYPVPTLLGEQSNVIEAKQLTLFIDIAQNHLLCIDCLKHHCKLWIFKSPFEDVADVGLLIMLESIAGSKLQKC